MEHHMKLHHAFHSKIIFCVIIAAFAAAPAFAQLGPCYHTRAKIDSFLIMLRDSDAVHHHIVHIDTIGWSRGEVMGHSYPLYAVKISANPDVWQDKPTALFVGQVHSEEVVGMETMLDLMWRMAVSQWGLYHNLTDAVQLYFVPTGNPEGLEVVSRNIDYTWRKTGYRPPQLDTCRIVQGAGGDSCGADINRNFDINWIYGDTLWDSTGSSPSERFDYYRGPGPFSEPESRAIRDLALKIKPTISAVFHSSRQGGNAARSIAAWGWKDADGSHQRFSPDSAAIYSLNDLYCQRLDAADHGSRSYIRDWSNRRYGNLQDWFYRELGTIQFNNELLQPDANIQPACSTLTEKITAFRTPLEFLCNRLQNADGVAQTPVNIHTYANTNPPAPISAEYRLLNTWNAILDPWYTDSTWGRATTLLCLPGQNRIMARREGYMNDTITFVVNPHQSAQDVSLYLDPLPWYDLTLHLRDASGNPISGRVYLKNGYEHWVTVPSGGAVIHLPQGGYTATAMADASDHMVLFRNFWLGGDGTQEFTLPPSHEGLSENFLNLNGWTIGGTGNPWGLEPDSTSMGFGTTLTTAPQTYRGQYDNSLNSTLTYNTAIRLDTNNVSYMTMWRRGRLDTPADSLMIEVSTDGGNAWEQTAGYSDLEIPWTQTWINLTPWAGHTILLRLRFKTDGVLGDLGLRIDNLAVYTGTDLAAPEKPVRVTYTYRIVGSYPNPFNPTTTIRYETAAPGLVTFVLFNTLGQEVRRFDVQVSAAGPQQLFWDGRSEDGSPVGSGLYFVQMHAATGTVATHKMLLLR
jgi:hypothetical protein